MKVICEYEYRCDRKFCRHAVEHEKYDFCCEGGSHHKYKFCPANIEKTNCIDYFIYQVLREVNNGSDM